MSEKIIWISIASANDENRMLKPHGYIDDKMNGNISLCGRISIYEDGKLSFNELVKNYKDEVLELGKCKHCERIASTV